MLVGLYTEKPGGSQRTNTSQTDDSDYLFTS